MKFSEYDVVILSAERPQDGLQKGEVGTVVAVFQEPNEAYEVEFVDDQGITKAQVALTPDEIEKYRL